MIIVFVGPTLRSEEVAAVCKAICLPPAAQGDIYRAARRRPSAIGIIDGFFSGAPAVWHKEILWALSEGIHVFGSASMGALRAAELHKFGMRGIGRIFEAFRDGMLEDDDEVAVLHGPAELGYLVTSEPMVNIRETLASAERQGIISSVARCALETFGKSQFFPERSWEALLAGKAAHGVAEQELAALRNWLPMGRIDQKRADALAMLTAMQDDQTLSTPFRPDFQFEHTHFWDEFVSREAVEGDGALLPGEQRVLEELRLEGPDVYRRVHAGALVRMIAARGGSAAAPPATPDAVRTTLAEIRTTLGLYTRSDLDRWMLRNDLDPASFERLLDNEGRAAILRSNHGHSMDLYLLDELRLTGSYERLAERARKKEAALATLALRGSAAGLSGPRALMLRLWFFEHRLGRPMPDDIPDFARKIGFADVAEFDAAIHREWLYIETGA